MVVAVVVRVRVGAAVAVDKAVNVVKARALDLLPVPRRPLAPRLLRPRSKVGLPALPQVDVPVAIKQPVIIHSDEAVVAATRRTAAIGSDAAVRAVPKVTMARMAVADSDEAVGVGAEVAIKRPCSIVSRACRPRNRSSSSTG